MGNLKVLIAYGTRYGSTGEIAQEIAKVLKSKGVEPELYNLGINKPKNWPQLDEYRGVIVGTSLKVNSWKKQVKAFLEQHKNELKNIKFGMFTCGAWAIAEPLEAYGEITMRLENNFELQADIQEAFKGVLDFSENSKVGKAGKIALKLTALALEKDKNIPVDQKARNDFRDWKKIRKFAEKFAALPKKSKKSKSVNNFL